ncbi:MAG: MCP four helix bundle domain-containing protein, partial [Desulfobulbus sp.]|nr:MCP four helix bundle domain-containing protein [Desulfobulbus sp.]
MKLNDFNIGTQLRLGLGIILAFVVLLGAFAWIQTDIMWQEAKGLYDHPYMVRAAIGEIKTDVLRIHRGVKDLCLAENTQETQSILQGMDTSEADAHRQFKIVYDRYLGPQSNIDEAFEAFVQWKAIREEIRRLLREGNQSEAIQRTRPNGSGGRQVEEIFLHIKVLSDFAKNQGNLFNLHVTKYNASLNRYLGILVGVILLLSLALSHFLIKGIKTPLKELIVVADQFRQGKLDARNRYTAANELGTLASAFNALAETIEKEMILSKQGAEINAAMLRELEARTFLLQVLELLMQCTGSQVGAIYRLNETKTDYEHLHSIGL